MFGIGFSEIVIIMLVVIVFVRPTDLPAFTRKLGRLYGLAKRTYNEIVSVKDSFIREMDIVAALKEAEKPTEKSAENVAEKASQPPLQPGLHPSDEGAGEEPVNVQE